MTNVIEQLGSPCVEGEGAANSSGYLQYQKQEHGVRTYELAHRRAYRTHYGVEIPKGWVVHHVCGEPGIDGLGRRCVNPHHLQAMPLRDHVAMHRALEREARTNA